MKIVEVGPRDGLQNETRAVPTEIKLTLIKKLREAGLKHIEATSFVSPKWVPQMADHQKVMQALAQQVDFQAAHYPVLTPNWRGYEAALAAGAREVAVFAAASESFAQKNTNCTIAESIERFKPILEHAVKNNILVRGYVSCVLGCPYEGRVSLDKVKWVTETLLDLGCYEVSLGDTIGVGTSQQTKRLIEHLRSNVPLAKLAVHFHDTWGQALANISTALDLGIEVIDSAVSGLGGCPYAKGASGNVATEDVLYLLKGNGVDTDIDLNKLVDAGQYICQFLGKQSNSKVALALLAQRQK